jgi:hypothetical protein
MVGDGSTFELMISTSELGTLDVVIKIIIIPHIL